jgi:hypothetical protein
LKVVATLIGVNYIDMQIKDACTCVGMLETVFHKGLFDGDMREGLSTLGMISVFPAEIVCPKSPSKREIGRFLRKVVITRRDISFVGVEDSLVVLGEDDTVPILNERVSLPTFQTV